MNVKKIKHIISCLLVLAPIIGIYNLNIGSLSLDIGNIILIMTVIIGIFILCNGSVWLDNSEKIYCFFILYTLITSFVRVVCSKTNEYQELIIKYSHIFCFCMIVLFLKDKLVDINEMLNYSIIIAVVSSLFVFLQFGMYKTTGIKIFGLPEIYRTVVTNNIERPCAFFVEPAHFCKYCGLPLFATLFVRNEKKYLYCSFIITAAMILTLSSIGYVVVFFLWGSKIITVIKKYKNPKLFIRFILIGIPVVCIIAKILFDAGYLTKIINHLSETDGNSITSGNVRVLRGFEIWKQENLSHKLFGVGFANVKNYLIVNDIRTIFDGVLKTGNEYMSAIAYILVMNGIVGFVIFIVFYLFMLFESRNNFKILVVLLLILMISNEEFMSIDFLNMIIVILMSIKYKKTFALKNINQLIQQEYI